MPPLNPMQLSVISDEYYFKGFVLGRDRLYEHMVQTYNINFGWGGTPNMFDSRDQVEEWLRYQHVNTIHQRQRKPKSIDHFRPVRPLHSISIDLIDYTKNGSSYTNPADGRISIYKYILIIIDNYSRYMWAFPLENKRSLTVGFQFWNWYTNHFNAISLAPPVFVQMDNGSEFAYVNVICVAMIGCTVVRSIPNVPQSNAMVERSIATLKRLLAKLIHIRHAGLVGISMTNLYGTPGALNNPVMWQQWILSLDKAVRIYNNTVHTSFGFKPVDAIDVAVVTHAAYLAGLKTHGAPAGQVDLNLGDVVRLQIFKGRIAKYDKNNWSVVPYIITNRRNVGNASRRTRYKITAAHPNQAANPGVTVGAQRVPWFYREHLNPINL